RLARQGASSPRAAPLTNEEARQDMTTPTARRPLGQILMETGVISAETLDNALARAQKTGQPIGETLIAMGAASRHHVAAAPPLRPGAPVSVAAASPTP